MSELSGSKFSIRLPHDLVIKLEAEKETIGVKTRVSMIEKCIRYYFENKQNEDDYKLRIENLEKEVENIKLQIKN